MSTEDDDIIKFKKILADFVAKAKSEEDLGLNLIDAVSAKYDEYISETKLIEQEALAVKRSTIGSIILRLKIKCPWLFGSPTAHLLKKNFIKSLYRSGAISKSQLYLLNSHSFFQVTNEGKFTIHLPSKNDFLISKLFLVVLFLLILLSAYVILTSSIKNIIIIPASYIDGSIIGLYMRWFYDLSWGRLKMVDFLVTKYPWLMEVK